MNVLGVDLSKNHYGLCTIFDDGKIEFNYSYFKPFLVRDKPTAFHVRSVDRLVIDGNYKYEEVCHKYDDKTNNSMLVDAYKSDIFIDSLKKHLSQIYGPVFISLEDYVAGDKIIQLVHVTESFKYLVAKKYVDKTATIMLCPNVTWKKYLGRGMPLKSDDKKDPYKEIKRCMALQYKEVNRFIESLNVKQDIFKDLIDSFGLANVYASYSPIFEVTYKKRLFTF